MARHPEWFDRLDAIEETLRQAEPVEWLGRQEIAAAFGMGDRDSIRLLHKFGAARQADALVVGRSALLAQLGGVRAGSAYQAFSRQREQLASHLEAARAESAARLFRVPPAQREPAKARLEDLPTTLTWRRASPQAPGHFEILYDDGADLMWQLAEFLAAAGVNREEFFRATEPVEPA